MNHQFAEASIVGVLIQVRFEAFELIVVFLFPFSGMGFEGYLLRFGCFVGDAAHLLGGFEATDQFPQFCPLF